VYKDIVAYRMSGLVSNDLSVLSDMCLRTRLKRTRRRTISAMCDVTRLSFCPSYTLSLGHRKQGTLGKRCCYARGYFPVLPATENTSIIRNIAINLFRNTNHTSIKYATELCAGKFKELCNLVCCKSSKYKII
jgi:hypothetical protein